VGAQHLAAGKLTAGRSFEPLAGAPHTARTMNVAPPSTVCALAGMHDASNRLDVAAHNVANANTEPFAPLRPDGTTDANVTRDLPTQMAGSLLDVLA
jgi:hypothetical protein